MEDLLAWSQVPWHAGLSDMMEALSPHRACEA